ncbi:hypothetical protein PHYSODRAFT_326819 [Phytophthora sojae]|uniref:HAT C-terminal dimerisation domain-containing protein n=1 Tax=Phytophthora sojae (strain P6497) TaxID=1094619 RepID=G4Z0K4_PHYSP|nr:hypothetical protein PHYSODRAFT_326819 [Phytophthora sojae]EGZ25853.1 hypothetical protein PHYSODRAFT_326819 [Phytophthora sojae]|eukprot:XP_009521141.1 hypothetical protein PHYSODRAFT_326819 [Phytophthora sojae]
MGEWEESRILRAIVTKDSFQAVANRRTITHAVIELYVSAKRELIRFIIDNRIPGVKCLVMVADVWKAKSSCTKFLGLRLYCVTADFKLVSVLLGTRHFQSLYDLFGATTDGGPDVQPMMTSNLMLSWEWCMPHLTNAATKAAFGMTSNVAKSKNPEILQLLKKVTQTVYQVRTVEVMGDLYEQLVRLLGVGKEKKLIDYKPHRFMSLTRVFERIVKHWNRSAEKPNQVDVLVSAYKVIVTTLGPEASIRKYDAMRENPTSYHHSTLMPLVVKTRELLSDAFHARFFSRYTDREVMRTCSYVWEMQMLLHPNLKQPDGALMEMVKTCGKLRRLDDDVIRRNQSVVKPTVKQKLRSIMRDLAPPCTEQINISPQQIPGYVSDAFSDDLSELFNIRTIAAEPATPQLLHEEVMDEELERWFRDPSLLQATAKGPESVLHVWKRQQESGTYRFLPSAARIVFAVSASSAQIERDFGISGQMVTVQRASLSSENIDMCSFLNRNREFIDVTQCSKLTAEEARESVPANVTVNLDPQTAMEMFESDWQLALVSSFSAHISTKL